MANSVTDVLKKVRKLLTNPKRWTQGCNSRDKSGNYTPVVSFADPLMSKRLQKNSEACSWCLSGAILYCISEGNPLLSDAWNKNTKVQARLCKYIPKGFSIPKYNDERSHRSVIRLIDKAIANKKVFK